MSIMYKLHKKKKTIVTIAILSGIAILLLMLLKPSQILTFEEGFTKLKEIDKKYNTSFHTEMLNKSMVPLAEIQPGQR